MVNSFVAEVLVMFLTKSFSVNWENERQDVLRGGESDCREKQRLCYGNFPMNIM